MSDDERTAVLRLVLAEADRLIEALGSADEQGRRHAFLLTQLAVAGIAGTLAAVAAVRGSHLVIGMGAGLLMAVGLLAYIVALIVSVRAYGDGRQEAGVGLGTPPGRYLNLILRGGAGPHPVLEQMIRDKDDIIRRSSIVIWGRLRCRDQGFVWLVVATWLVLVSIALIVGGHFLG